MNSHVWAEIDRLAIAQNLDTIRRAVLPETGIIAVVKANAYGHGLVEVGQLIESKVDMFGVTSMEEAFMLRRVGIGKAILNLSYTAAEEVEEAIARRIAVSIYDLDLAKVLHEQAAALHKPLKVHVKIDTGMHRLGILAEDVAKALPVLLSWPYFRVEGLYSHFADATDKVLVKKQYEAMQSCLWQLQKAGHVVPAVHMAKSSVLFLDHQYHFDAVRPGIAIYGYGVESSDLRPALALKTILVHKKKISAGSYVGYQQTFKATKDTLIGVVPLGYSHGYDARMSNTGNMLIDGWRCPVIGKVCMSQTILDLSSARSRLVLGDEVVALGQQKNQTITADDWVAWTGGTVHEMLARIPESVERRYT